MLLVNDCKKDKNYKKYCYIGPQGQKGPRALVGPQGRKGKKGEQGDPGFVIENYGDVFNQFAFLPPGAGISEPLEIGNTNYPINLNEDNIIYVEDNDIIHSQGSPSIFLGQGYYIVSYSITVGAIIKKQLASGIYKFTLTLNNIIQEESEQLQYLDDSSLGVSISATTIIKSDPILPSTTTRLNLVISDPPNQEGISLNDVMVINSATISIIKIGNVLV